MSRPAPEGRASKGAYCRYSAPEKPHVRVGVSTKRLMPRIALARYSDPVKKGVLFASLALAAFAASAMQPPHARPAYREGQILVKYRPGASPAALAAKRDLALRVRASFLGGRLEALELPAVTSVAQVLPLLRSDPVVAYAEPNFVRTVRATNPPDDTYFSEQWGLNSTGQPNYLSTDPALASIPGDDLDMLAAWDSNGDGTFDRVGDGSVTVAVIDDSVKTTHPDLAANIVPGYDFLNGDTNPDPDPGTDQGHGTMVAGCIGAVGNNGIGVAGTAWNVTLMPLKFAFDTASFLSAMEFARTHGAKIVNASFGGPGFSQAEADEIDTLRAAGILFVAAAGNDDSNTDVAQLNYPANYDVDNIVSVAATNRQDDIASFSQYGPLTTEVAAPGLQIVTTTNDGYSLNPGVTGTSFAAPYTAGIAALLMMQYPSATLSEIKARLIEGAEPGGNVNHRTAGGRVDAANSLNLAPRPALVIQRVDWIDPNGALDPGDAVTVNVTLQNLWQDATNVSGTLSEDSANGITVSDGAVSFGAIAANGTATATFHVSVPAGITGHHYVDFKLSLSADGPYAAERHFLSEIGQLGATEVTQDFAPSDQDLYDDFHAWHYDFAGLPPGDGQLVIEMHATPDLDLLVKKDQPPRYDITLGLPPDAASTGFFCTSGTAPGCMDPDTYVSGGPDGNETVVINNPTPGTYHIFVVNFAQQSAVTTYTLRAYTRPAPSSGGGGGGALPPSLLGTLLLAFALRLRRRAA